ncbi:MAG: hypothetical protein OXC28_07350 [Defluviicoccus sp.]|nr:hypothetical protein [Defluviicoccus sp.]
MNAQRLTRLARIYAEARNITMGSLGTYLVRDAYFFDRLATGRVTIRRAERALQWLSDHWPAGLDWPADIERPPPGAGAEPGEAA